MAREIRVAILGDSRDFSRAVNSAEDDARRLDGAFGRIASGAARLGGAVAVGMGVAVAAGGALAHSFIQAAEESQQVARQTDAVIRSMGGAANVTAEHVAALAEQLSLMSGVDDELIQSGQNVLMTFGGIANQIGEGNDIFDRATKAALDMSVALGTDMAGAAMLIGKALNDPAEGLSRLARSGVLFTAQQEEQIVAMAAAGDAAGAQQLMLAELERQFGGSAEAQATASARMSVAWGNLQEALGEKLLPVFEKLTNWVIAHLPEIQETIVRVAGAGVRAFKGLVDFLRPAIDAIKGVFDGFATTSDDGTVRVESFADKASAAFEKIKAWVDEHWPEIRDTIVEVMTTIQEIVSGVLEAISIIWENYGEQISQFVAGTFTMIMGIINGAMQAIKGIIDIVLGILSGDWERVWDGIKGLLGGVWDAMVAMIVGYGERMIAIVSALWETVRSGVSTAWDGIKDTISAAIDRTIEFVQGMPQRIRNAASGMWDGIKDAFRSAINWLIRTWNALQFTLPSIDTHIPGVGRVGGFTLGTPDIPQFHTGGTFNAPAGRTEGLALLSNGERVLSPGESRGGGMSTVIVKIGDHAIVSALVDWSKSNGAVPITVEAVA